MCFENLAQAFFELGEDFSGSSFEVFLIDLKQCKTTQARVYILHPFADVCVKMDKIKIVLLGVDGLFGVILRRSLLVPGCIPVNRHV
jgi:hypothetical protein